MTDWLGNSVGYAYADPYDPSDVTSITYPSGTGVTASYLYDPAHNLGTLEYTTPNTTVGSTQQQVDSWHYNGDEQQLTSSFNNGSTSAQVSYDTYKHVTAATEPGDTTDDSYAVSNNGELLSDTTPSGSATSFGYNAGDELCWSAPTSTAQGTSNCSTSSAPSGATTYAFNADGQRQSQTTPSTTTAYGWNAYGQLTCSGPTPSSSISCGGIGSSPTTYTYNGENLRMTATTGAATTDFTWDMVNGGSLPLDVNVSTASSSESYIYGPLLFGGVAPVEQISSSGVASFLVSNQTGVQAVVSAAGQLLEQATYSLYGTPTIAYGSGGASAFGFQGSYTDPSGLLYLINRYYDPSTDQFLSVDPEVAETKEPYAYTGDDPLNALTPWASWLPLQATTNTTGNRKPTDNSASDTQAYEAIAAGDST